MQVSELMPEVSILEGGMIGDVDVATASEGFQHRQMRRARLVEARYQSIDYVYAAFRRDDEVGPALGRAYRAVR